LPVEADVCVYTLRVLVAFQEMPEQNMDREFVLCMCYLQES
jgi:hypothetical protein